MEQSSRSPARRRLLTAPESTSGRSKAKARSVRSSNGRRRTLQSLGSNLIIVLAGTVTFGGVRLGTGSKVSITEDDAWAIQREVPSVEVAAPSVQGKAQDGQVPGPRAPRARAVGRVRRVRPPSGRAEPVRALGFADLPQRPVWRRRRLTDTPCLKPRRAADSRAAAPGRWCRESQTASRRRARPSR